MKKGRSYYVHIRVDNEGRADYSYPVFITPAGVVGSDFHNSVEKDNYDYIFLTDCTLGNFIHMILNLHKDTTIIYDAYNHYRMWQDGYKIVDISR